MRIYRRDGLKHVLKVLKAHKPKKFDEGVNERNQASYENAIEHLEGAIEFLTQEHKALRLLLNEVVDDGMLL